MNDPVPAALMSRFSALLASRLGLHFPPERWPDLERGLRAAAGGLGCADALESVRVLLAEPWRAGRVDALAEHLTVGETYFLRDPQVFEALEKMILPALIRARSGGAKRLRIWSAGCSTGEEAYSIAITLAKALPFPRQWQITVLATDLNARFLATAAQGVYTRWSFRSVPKEWQELHFAEISPREFEVRPEYKRMVSFSRLNLARDAYPSTATNTDAMDVIFCRNVLMYFSPEQARRAAGKLVECLADGGWLVTSAGEASRETFDRLSRVSFPGAILYTKTPGRPAGAWPTEGRLPAPPLMPVSAMSEDSFTPGAREPAMNGVAPQEDADAAHNARAAANQGRLGEALAWCDKALARDKASAALYYLRGTIQDERSAMDEAGGDFRRALYLDPQFVLAHFALGNVLRKQGRQKESLIYFHNTLGLLEKLQPGEVLPESADITAGGLFAILKSLSQPAA